MSERLGVGRGGNIDILGPHPGNSRGGDADDPLTHRRGSGGVAEARARRRALPGVVVIGTGLDASGLDRARRRRHRLCREDEEEREGRDEVSEPSHRAAAYSIAAGGTPSRRERGHGEPRADAYQPEPGRRCFVDAPWPAAARRECKASGRRLEPPRGEDSQSGEGNRPVGCSCFQRAMQGQVLAHAIAHLVVRGSLMEVIGNSGPPNRQGGACSTPFRSWERALC